MIRSAVRTGCTVVRHTVGLVFRVISGIAGIVVVVFALLTNWVEE